MAVGACMQHRTQTHTFVSITLSGSWVFRMSGMAAELIVLESVM